MEDEFINSEKQFDIKINSINNKPYLINFILIDNLEIKAQQINGIFPKSFRKEFTLKEIEENNSFKSYNFIDLFCEIKERILNNKIMIKENENNLILNIPFPSSKNKEIVFELQQVTKNNKEKIDELIDLIIKQNKEIEYLKNEVNFLKNKEIAFLKNEIILLKNKDNVNVKGKDIKIKKKEKVNLNKEYKIINDNRMEYLVNKKTQIKYEIQRQNNIAFYYDRSQYNEIKKQNTIFLPENKKELKNEIKKQNTMFLQNNKELMKNKIQKQNNENNNTIKNIENMKVEIKKEEYLTFVNRESKIIHGNEKKIKSLKKAINPTRKIRAELLYRMSENGDNFSTFHELCDNQGPTLTLFQVDDGNKVGIYTPLSWNTTSNWKNDMETFIFNLNKFYKFKKLKDNCSIYCNKLSGPVTAGFGCVSTSMKYLKHIANAINKYYKMGSEILPSNNITKDYNLLETEVFKIIIE